MFLFILPGLFAWALWKNGGLDLKAITTVVDGKETVNSKGIYTIMITQLLSPGLVGAIVAAMLAGLMSNVAASLNSISTLVSYNLYRRLKPDSSEVQVVLVGRIAVVVAIVVGIGAVYLAKNYDSIFAGINDIIAHIAPPITTVFLIGVFWRRRRPWPPNTPCGSARRWAWWCSWWRNAHRCGGCNRENRSPSW